MASATGSAIGTTRMLASALGPVLVAGAVLAGVVADVDDLDAPPGQVYTACA